ncbi:penicillin acylase family protein [Thalassotalea profundi]|uniref:Penicillin acylase n=1 Tax=Thalassotalea profundi TaxID=2036687 RepID=A0ABQ3IUN7_9GAMM|nr:penicillin acylase family protein [Thalassotalea profundi]GHE92189.1 penicillin acylase [Thalassotalea profundi]
MMSIKRIALIISIITFFIFAIITTWIYSQLEGSLPLLEGKINVYGLTSEANIARDEQGISTITANNREDIAVATGFVHAQERFFQMDLFRKNSAGELASLFGSVALDYDKSHRLHNFRQRAIDIVKHLPDQERSLLTAYTKGVNAGLRALKSPPFEYLLLQQAPAQWREEDSILVIMSMYLDLQYGQGEREQSLAALYKMLEKDVFAFLNPSGSQWDAPIDNTEHNEEFSPPSLPISTWPNLSTIAKSSRPTSNIKTTKKYHPEEIPGSNNWVISGSISSTGSAIIANDMHLRLSVPNTWYRTSFSYPLNTQQIDITGLTLPGTPLMVTGSNGNIAWGFTNSYGDWSDVIILETNEDKTQYLTPQGYKPFTMQRHMIAVKGEKSKEYIVKETIWGPVINEKADGTLLAYRWVAHDRQAVNLYAQALEYTKTAKQALTIAAKSGIPQQNFVVGDSSGNIGWTIMGPIPQKSSSFGELPQSWANGNYTWKGYLAAENYPKVLNPEQQRIWTANSRVVGGEMYKYLGNGGYALGARSKQIKQRLFAKERFSEKDLLAIALDDEALFLKPWRDFIINSILNKENLEENSQLLEVSKILLADDTLTASIDSVAYRIVRNFRLQLRDNVFSHLEKHLTSTDKSFDLSTISHQLETPLWQLINVQPDNFIIPNQNWQQLFTNTLRQVVTKMTQNQPLSAATWGQQNTSNIRHPLSAGVPLIGNWLDMPKVPLSGDSYMPRVQGRSFGASQRMIVSPGHEKTGIMQVPTSQSGHPWSPYYQKGHKNWQEGLPSSFLPGETKYQLTLTNY